MLVELTKVEGTRHGRLLADQMLDVAIRVKTVRPFAVKQMVRCLHCVLLFLHSFVCSVCLFCLFVLFVCSVCLLVCHLSVSWQ